jgi:hypothetical protein
VAHLGILEALREAEAALASRPGDAASGFAFVADRLEASAFSSHAARLRDHQAAALTAAGRPADAAEVRLRLGWQQFQAGDPFSALDQVRHLAELAPHLPESLRRSGAALSAAAGHAFEHSVTLDDLAGAFDDLRDVDPHRAEAGLAVAEEAVTARCPELVLVPRMLALPYTITATGSDFVNMKSLLAEL